MHLQVLAALRDGRTPEPEPYDCVTVIFCDIVDFHELSATLQPQQVSPDFRSMTATQLSQTVTADNRSVIDVLFTYLHTTASLSLVADFHWSLIHAFTKEFEKRLLNLDL